VEAALRQEMEARPQEVQSIGHIASKETGFMAAPPETGASVQPAGMGAEARAELGEILAELYALRAMLRKEAA
jgi:hypothetical protein